MLDGFKRLFIDSSRKNMFTKGLKTHMTCTAFSVCNDHNLAHIQFINGHQQTAHGRIKGRDDKSTCILYQLRITIFKS